MKKTAAVLFFAFLFVVSGIGADSADAGFYRTQGRGGGGGYAMRGGGGHFFARGQNRHERGRFFRGHGMARHQRHRYW